MNCPNCNQKLSCGCQNAVANDGTKLCTICKSAYDAAHPVTLLKNSNAPSNVKVIYNPPKRK